MATYLSSLTVVDLWVFRRVTDRTEDRRLARVSPADDEDPEATEFLVEVFQVSACVFCRHSVESVREEQ